MIEVNRMLIGFLNSIISRYSLFYCPKFLSYFARLKFKTITLFTKIFLSNLRGVGDINEEEPQSVFRIYLAKYRR